MATQSDSITPLENLLGHLSVEWDQYRLQELGFKEGHTKKQEDVIRSLGPHIQKSISVQEFVPHFQTREKLINDGDEQELERLAGNSVEQGAKLFTILVNLSRGDKPILRALLLSLMDSYEDFKGGCSTHSHWALVGLLLDKVHGVSKSRLPDMTQIGIDFTGIEFENGKAVAFAESLELENKVFHSYEQIFEEWIKTGEKCTLPNLVRALLLTRGLGKLVTELFSPCRSNSPVVLTWFSNLKDKEWKKVASFVGLEAEKLFIEDMFYSDDNVATQMFLRRLRIPDCRAATQGIMMSLGKVTKVKYKTGGKKIRAQAHVPTITLLDEIVLFVGQRGQPTSSSKPDISENSEYEETEINQSDSEYTAKTCESEQSTSVPHRSQTCSLPDIPDDTIHQQAKVLLEACEAKDWETAKVLLGTQNPSSEFVEVLSQGCGKTALHYACAEGITELVDLLLDRGADATKLTTRGLSVLNYPRVFRNEDMLKRLLVEFTRKSTSVDTADNKNQLTPLMLVCKEGDTLHGSAELLLENGASPDGPKLASSRPLIIACEGGHERLVKLLLSKQVDLNSRDKKGNTALLQACRARQFNIAKLLLDNPGINVNLSDKSGTTPLFEAITSNDLTMTKRLLDLEALVNARRYVSNEMMRGSVEETPLAHACARGFGELVTLLIERGADVNYKCSDTVPPIAFAIICCQEHVIKQLLKCSALDITIYGLSAPIIFAIKVGNFGCAKQLIDLLGGTKTAFHEASKLQLDQLAEQIQIFETVDPLLLSAQEQMFKRQDEATGYKTHLTIGEADKHATLDRFCHLCVLLLRENEHVSIEELASTAQALHPENPKIASFLLGVAKYEQAEVGLWKEFLFGFPSPLTILISQGIITPEDFFTQALRYYKDEPEDFYTKLVASFHTIQHGENLPFDIEGVLNRLCNGQFQINMKIGYSSDADSFPPNDMLPEEFRVKQSPGTSLATSAYPDSFPPNDMVPEEFRVEQNPGTSVATSIHPVAEDGFPVEDVLPPEFRSTSRACNSGCTKGYRQRCEVKHSTDVSPKFPGEGFRLGSLPDHPLETVSSITNSNRNLVTCKSSERALSVFHLETTQEALENSSDQIVQTEPSSLPSLPVPTVGSISALQTVGNGLVSMPSSDYTRNEKELAIGVPGVPSDLNAVTADRRGRLSRRLNVSLSQSLSDTGSETPEEERTSSGLHSTIEAKYVCKPGNLTEESAPDTRQVLPKPSPNNSRVTRSTSRKNETPYLKVKMNKTARGRLDQNRLRSDSDPTKKSKAHGRKPSIKKKAMSEEYSVSKSIFKGHMYLSQAPTLQLLMAICSSQRHPEQYKYVTFQISCESETDINVRPYHTYFDTSSDSKTIKAKVKNMFEDILYYFLVDGDCLVDVEVFGVNFRS